VIFLDLEELLHIARRTLGAEPEIRDVGLLESALARPPASALGEDAYPSIHDKAAALLHSVTRNHALMDGNKRLGLASTIAFSGMNGMRLTLTNDQAYELVIAVASGQLDDVSAIATVLGEGTTARRSNHYPRWRSRKSTVAPLNASGPLRSGSPSPCTA
jgi:death on curing protein